MKQETEKSQSRAMKEHSKSRDARVNVENEEDVETGGGIECPSLHFSPSDGRSTR